MYNGVGSSSGEKRSLPKSIWNGAPRLHNGGMIKKGEIPAILQTGEEVLTRNDPRNVLNGKQQTANIYMMLDRKIIARAMGVPLVKEIRLRTGIIK